MLITGKTWGMEDGQVSWAVLLSGLVGVIATLAVAVIAARATIKHERKLARDERMRTMLAQMVTGAMNTDERWQTYTGLLKDLTAGALLLRMSLEGRAGDVPQWTIDNIEQDRPRLAKAETDLDPAGKPAFTHVTVEFTHPRVVNVLLLWGEAKFPNWSRGELDRRLAKQPPAERTVRR